MMSSGFPLLRLNSSDVSMGYGLPQSQSGSLRKGQQQQQITVNLPQISHSDTAAASLNSSTSSLDANPPQFSSLKQTDDFYSVNASHVNHRNIYDENQGEDDDGYRVTGPRGYAETIGKVSNTGDGTSHHHQSYHDAIREQKISELSRKIKTLNLALEKEKSQNASFRNALKKQELELQNAKSQCKNQDDETTSATATTQTKLNYLTRKLEQEQVKSQHLKRDLQTALKILKSEMGSADLEHLSNVTVKNPGWRGRAQQIVILKEKLKDLEAQTNHQHQKQQQRQDDCKSSYSSVKDLKPLYNGGNVVGGQDLKKASELEKIVETERGNYEKLKSKVLGYKARIKNLEEQNGELKQKLHLVLEKTELDDQMISALKKRLSSLVQSE